jgi:hypothetical protein
MLNCDLGCCKKGKKNAKSKRSNIGVKQVKKGQANVDKSTSWETKKNKFIKSHILWKETRTGQKKREDKKIEN